MVYEPQKQKTEISKIDKQIVGIFAFLGLATLFFGFLQFRTNIKEPFNAFLPDYNIKSNEQIAYEKLADLKLKDSDGDTLNDYDELYQYNTSPYISDSDSDNIPDNEEIKNGTDPNCIEGRECIQARSDASNENVNGLIKASDLTPDQVRQLLAENGIPQTNLDTLDDATLMQLYNEVLAETNTTVGETNTNVNTTAKTNSNTNDPYANLLAENTNAQSNIEDLSNLSATEVRKLLVSTGGISEETLNNLSDEQVISIFQESLKNQ